MAVATGALVVHVLTLAMTSRPVISRPRVARRWFAVMLAGTTLATVTLLVAAVRAPTWELTMSTGIAMVTTAGVWFLHWLTSGGRPDDDLVTRLLWRRIRKPPLTGWSGPRMLRLSQLRAEYGQGVLDDAARDPHLDLLLTRYAEALAASLSTPAPGQPRPAPLNLLTVTAYANGYLESMSDPHRGLAGHSPYRGYSRDMLVLAALCRLADLLDGGDLPFQARPAG